MATAERDDWETPQKLFEELDAEFHFNLDVASSDLNCKCERHFTIEDNGLEKSWGGGHAFIAIHPTESRLKTG